MPTPLVTLPTQSWTARVPVVGYVQIVATRDGALAYYPAAWNQHKMLTLTEARTLAKWH